MNASPQASASGSYAGSHSPGVAPGSGGLTSRRSSGGGGGAAPGTGITSFVWGWGELRVFGENKRWNKPQLINCLPERSIKHVYVPGTPRHCVVTLGHGGDVHVFLDELDNEPFATQTGMNVKQLGCGKSQLVALTDAGHIFECDLRQMDTAQQGMSEDSDAASGLPFHAVVGLEHTAISCVACSPWQQYYNVAVTADGDLYTWERTQRDSPAVPSSNGNSCPPLPRMLYQFQVPISQVACGKQHSVAVGEQMVYSWGCGDDGRLGHHSLQSESTPRSIAALEGKGIVQVSCGFYHTAVVSAGGNVSTWGQGQHGQLGHGKSKNEMVPRQVDELKSHPIAQVSTGAFHTIVRTMLDGDLYSFGWAAKGQLGHGTTAEEDATAGGGVGMGQKLVCLPRKITHLQGMCTTSVGCGGDVSVCITSTQGQPAGMAVPSYPGAAVTDQHYSPRRTFAGLVSSTPLTTDSLRSSVIGGGPVSHSTGQRDPGSMVIPGSGASLTAFYSPPPASSNRPSSRGGSVLYSAAAGADESFTDVPFTPDRSGLNTSSVSQQSRTLPPTPQSTTAKPLVPQQSAAAAGGTDDGQSLSSSMVSGSQAVASADGAPHAGSSSTGAASSSTFATPQSSYSESGTAGLVSGHQARSGDHHSSLLADDMEQARVEWSLPPDVDTSSEFEDDVDDAPSQHCGLSQMLLSLGTTLMGIVPPTRGTGLATNASTHRQRSMSMKKEDEVRQLTNVWQTQILPRWETLVRKGVMPAEVRKTWLKGIPATVRREVWPRAIGNKLVLTKELYEINLARAKQSLERHAASSEHGSTAANPAFGREATVAHIDVDLPRTFPDMAFFKEAAGENGISAMREVLGAYALYRPDVGYVQGMSYLAYTLLLYIEDPMQAFVCLANLLNTHSFVYLFRMDMPEVRRRFAVLSMLLMDHVPALHRHLHQMNLTPEMYCVEWFLTLYSKVLPVDISTKIWDIYLLEGEVYLFKVAVGIHKVLCPRLLNAGFEECLKILQNLSHQGFTRDELDEAISGVHVPQDIIKVLYRLKQDEVEAMRAHTPGSSAKSDTSRFSVSSSGPGVKIHY